LIYGLLITQLILHLPSPLIYGLLITIWYLQSPFIYGLLITIGIFRVTLFTTF
jgi:hypothetical protein